MPDMRAGHLQRILLVEDDVQIRVGMAAGLVRAGYDVVAVGTAGEATGVIARSPLDLVLSDVLLPMGSGFDVADYARRTHPGLPVILMSSFGEEEMGQGAAELGVRRFLRKPLPLSEVIKGIRAVLAEGALAVCETPVPVAPESPLHSVKGRIRGLVKLIGLRDRYTQAHSTRVRCLVSRLTREMGLNAEQRLEVILAAWVHDVGKIAIPSRILNKPGPLTTNEFAEVQRHPVIGAEILTGLGLGPNVVAAVRHHHERYDGAVTGRFPGYPDGLAGDRIPFQARILTVVDSFDAMTTPRVYRGPATTEETLAQMESLAGSHYDPTIVGVFLGMMRRQLTLKRSVCNTKIVK